MNIHIDYHQLLNSNQTILKISMQHSRKNKKNSTETYKISQIHNKTRIKLYKNL